MFDYAHVKKMDKTHLLKIAVLSDYEHNSKLLLLNAINKFYIKDSTINPISLFIMDLYGFGIDEYPFFDTAQYKLNHAINYLGKD